MQTRLSMAVVFAVALYGCGGIGSGEWTKPAASTTCDDWLSQMTEEQRQEMIGPMLYDIMVDMGADKELLTDEALSDDVLQAGSEQVTALCADEPGVAGVPTVLQREMEATVDRIFEDVGEELGN